MGKLPHGRGRGMVKKDMKRTGSFSFSQAKARVLVLSCFVLKGLAGA